MISKTVLKRHADLVDRMANRLGMDLEQVMMEGRMTIDQLGDAVLACTGCSCAGQCDRWLQDKGDTAPTAPGYCRNGEIWSRLGSGKSA